MVKTALALTAFLLSGAALAAPESINKVDTSKSEMLLEVIANGSSSAKIIKVSTTCDMKATAQGKSEAMALLKKQQDGLSKALSDAGLISAKLDFTSAATFSEESYAAAAAASAVDAAMAAATEASDVGAAATANVPAAEVAKSFVTYTRRVGISTGLATEMQEVRGIITEYSCDEDYRALRNTAIETEKPDLAKASAAKIAITSAKTQAENYASALNLKVVRLLRVSEVGAIREFFGPEVETVLREMRSDRDRQSFVTNELTVSVTISADFVLGPK
jgi:hypothetical protein